MGFTGSAVCVALLLALLGGTYYQGREDGKSIVREQYAQRDLEASKASASAILRLSNEARDKEAKWQQSLAAVSKDYQRKLDANATALVTANAVRLRDPGSGYQACGSQASTVAANPGATYAGGAELSISIDRFLKSEASRADAVVEKLNYCISTLEVERQK